MKNLLKIILVYILVTNNLFAQSKSKTEMEIAIDLADEQLKAYNNRDIENFLAIACVFTSNISVVCETQTTAFKSFLFVLNQPMGLKYQ